MTYRVKLFRGEEMVFMAESHDQSYVVNALSAHGRSTPTQASWFLDTPKSPVRTETITRTVIEPGVYGRLWVGVDHDGWANIAIVPALTDAPEWEAPDDQQRSLNSTELRELARIATELADGLDA